MYCPRCNCEYSGWNGRCPGCSGRQFDGSSRRGKSEGALLPYDDLVALVRESGGRLAIPLATAVHCTHKTKTFPYFGHGFAWARRMEATNTDILVDLEATEVGMQVGRRFPYIGRGYAWAECLEGYVGGNQVVLNATELGKEQKWAFPYTGFGRAWVERMRGTCGDQLRAYLATTRVARGKERDFPYFGFGYGWAAEATLILTLAD